MDAFFSQFIKIWRKIHFFQKMLVVGILVSLSVYLFYLLLPNRNASYVPLFKHSLDPHDISLVKTYLNQYSIPYKEEKEKGLLVQEGYVERLRLELMEANLPKQSQRKGFELFDANTWLKGDKELQVLEMRALKGQLEKDLTAFEHIKSANVILDIPPTRQFSPSPYSTKASVILTLVPNARLHLGHLKAITHHLTGAVRGLKPHMIAISDTTGKLYKEIQEEPKEKLFEEELLLEEEIKEKIDALLKMHLKNESFMSTIKILEQKKAYISLLIDSKSVEQQETFQENLSKQIEELLACFGKESSLSIQFIPLEPNVSSLSPIQEEGRVSHVVVLFFFFAILLTLAFFFFFKKLPIEKKEEEPSEGDAKVNLVKLAESMLQEDPKTIALLLSYLEPSRAEKMIQAFPEKMQEAIFMELEKGSG